MQKSIFLLALAPCLAFASKSVSLAGVTGRFTVPNSPAFRSVSSFWIDIRIHGYTIPTGTCTNLVQVAGPTQIRLCDNLVAGGGILTSYPVVQTAGGVPNIASPPALAVLGMTKTNPAVLSLAAAPYPAVTSPGSVITVWGDIDSSCPGLNGNHTIQAVNGFSVTINYDATNCSYTSGAKLYGQDVLLRLSVNQFTNQVSGETWNVDGTGYTVFTQGILSSTPLALPQGDITVGPSPANLAYFRWCSGTVPLNSTPPTSSLTAPCGSAPVLADWEFEGNLADSGPNRLSLSFSPNPSYIASPIYGPACNPGPSQTFRAGTSGTVDASRSFPLDGGSTLQLEWQYLPSVEPGISGQLVHWTSLQTAQLASFDSFIAGPLNFQLTVTDSSGQSASCVVHDGAVATDDNSNIVFSDPKLGQILGPLTRWGDPNARWPWVDAIQRVWADKFGGFQGLTVPGGIVTDFVDSWNVAQTGQVDCVQNQATCTGHGTSFQKVFCGGDGNTTPVSSNHFVGWYAYTAPNGGGGTGRRVMNVASCPSETSITLTSSWIPPTQTMSYSLWTDTGVGTWVNGSTNINYYDSVMAFYAMYYRTGVDTYLHYARWLADAWWTMPIIDRGNGNDCLAGSFLCPNSPTFPRIFSMTGMYLRAMDQDAVAGTPGSSPMWPGIRMMTDGIFRYPPNLTAKIGDLRENSYLDMFVALCAAYDPDPAHASACRADVATILDNVWKPVRFTDGSWKAFAGVHTSLGTLWPDTGDINPGLTVTVQPGSSVVTLNGGTWPQSWFPTGSAFFSLYQYGASKTYDSRSYQISWVDSTHATITPAYADNCVLAGNSCSGRSFDIGPPLSAVGFGTQPYMLGIAGHWFNQAYIALSADPAYDAEAALARNYVIDAATWITKSTLDGSGGVDPSTRGALYGVGFGQCTPGDDVDGCRCGPNNANCPSVVASRENVAEAMGALAIAYSYAPSPSLLAAIDNVYSANFARSPGDPGYDGTYANDLDGFFLATNNPKWLGFFWGMGRNSDFLSSRQGGLIAPVIVPVQLTADINAVPGAAKFRVILTDPSGRGHPSVLCTSSPCAVNINKVIGSWTMQIQYLSASGAVISTGRPFSVAVK